LLKVAHLIVAFKYPEQLYRLAKSLSQPGTDVFIHIDKKVDIRQFEYLTELPNVHFIKNRQYIVWGGYSITECYITSMKEILEHGTYDYFVLMSGQDYPLKPMEELHRFLKDHKGYSVMSVEEKAPKSKWWLIAVDRYKYYHLNDFRFHGHKLVHKISKRILPNREFVFPDYQLYGGPGATFCALTRQAAEYLANFMATNPKAYRFARFTHASDEFWFQTLLMNSPLREKIVNKPMWYIDWKGASKHPRILTVLDYPSLVNSGMFFARKFDMYEDEMILDMLDVHLNERKNLRTLLAE
jgi:hypothetical protein